MAIFKVGNVRVKSDSNRNKVIIDNSQSVMESVEFINKHSIDQVEINDFEYTDLNFLQECPSIEILSIHNHFLKDLNGIYNLTKLRVLAINETTTKVEFRLNELKNLEELYGTLPQKTVGINELKRIKKVELWGYKPKSRNLNEFSSLKSLKELNITQSRIDALDGIEGLLSLKKLGLYHLRTIVDITALEEVKAPITELSLENCKSIGDFQPIHNLKGLESLKILACGELPSLSFVSKLTKLKSLVFADTNILDGNLTVCDGIEYVYYTK